MHEHTAILLDQRRFERWAAFTLGSAQLAAVQAGQLIALRCASVGSYDPLLRQPLFVAAADRQVATCTLLVPDTDPAHWFLNSQPRGAALDILGPLGHGWKLGASVRTLALLGTTAQAPALFGLAHDAVGRGLAVSVVLGARDKDSDDSTDAGTSAPPPFLLPAAAEYNITHGPDPAAAALALLDEQLLRWADLLALALPSADLPQAAQRVRSVRLQWPREFAQAALLDPADARLVCCVGVCGVCGIEAKQGRRLVCSAGPVFDLRDLVR
ncbi:MAG TPA: hypothetical protein VFZ66_01650 [Herpetosiphonaceae bacterium]